MIDYDLQNDFSYFLKDTNTFFKEFNKEFNSDIDPGAVVESKDQVGLCIAYLLSRIADSLKNIEDAVKKNKF